MTDEDAPEGAAVLSVAQLQALDELHASASTAAPHELAALFEACAHSLGATDVAAYLVDLQQEALHPLVAPTAPDHDEPLTALGVDATLAGRAYRTLTPQTQVRDDGRTQVWLPLLAAAERLGVLTVTVAAGPASDLHDVDQHAALTRFAAAAGGLIWAKLPFGDSLVRLRRRSQLGLPAELQYSILPPLSFASQTLTVAAALEPCYHVAGDAIDYSVDDGRTRVAVFDGMGHGLHSAQCAVFTVAAYRNARRTGQSLTQSLQSIDEALASGLGGEVFTTAVLAELDTRTGALQWVNAGHPEPLLLRGNRLIRALESAPRPPLGLGHLLDDHPAEIGREQLEPGDIVLLYTDGVTEARAPGGEFFGAERLVDLIVRHLAGGLSAQETLRRVVRELLTHHDGQLTDDATLLLLQWNGPAEADALIAPG